MSGFPGWIVFGLIVGALAKFLMPGKDPGGIIVTILLGIVGALLGGWLGRAMGLYAPGDPVGYLMAIIRAIILLVAYRFMMGGQGMPRPIDHREGPSSCVGRKGSLRSVVRFAAGVLELAHRRTTLVWLMRDLTREDA